MNCRQRQAARWWVATLLQPGCWALLMPYWWACPGLHVGWLPPAHINKMLDHSHNAMYYMLLLLHAHSQGAHGGGSGAAAGCGRRGFAEAAAA
jgi:hypothetical protein